MHLGKESVEGTLADEYLACHISLADQLGSY